MIKCSNMWKYCIFKSSVDVSDMWFTIICAVWKEECSTSRGISTYLNFPMHNLNSYQEHQLSISSMILFLWFHPSAYQQDGKEKRRKSITCGLFQASSSLVVLLRPWITVGTLTASAVTSARLCWPTWALSKTPAGMCAFWKPEWVYLNR